MYVNESVAVVVVANVVIVFQLLVFVADVRFFKPVLNLLAQLYSLFLTSASRALQNDVTKSGWERALNEGTSTVIRYTYHAYSHVRTSFTQKLSSLISVDFFKPALRCFYNIFLMLDMAELSLETEPWYVFVEFSGNLHSARIYLYKP